MTQMFAARESLQTGFVWAATDACQVDYFSVTAKWPAVCVPQASVVLHVEEQRAHLRRRIAFGACI